MGNPTSDKAELAGLLPALASGLGSKQRHVLVLLGHKSNFGHSICAAGIISVIASTAALYHGVVAVHLGVTTAFEILRSSDTVLLPTDSPAPFEVASKSIGSVNGTSVSGDNIHIVVLSNLQYICDPWLKQGAGPDGMKLLPIPTTDDHQC